MYDFRIRPPDLHDTGARVTRVAQTAEAEAIGPVRSMPDVSEPPATAPALDTFKSEWQAGIARLAEDIRVLGALTHVAANGYVDTDNDAARAFSTPAPFGGARP